MSSLTDSTGGRGKRQWHPMGTGVKLGRAACCVAFYDEIAPRPLEDVGLPCCLPKACAGKFVQRVWFSQNSKERVPGNFFVAVAVDGEELAGSKEVGCDARYHGERAGSSRTSSSSLGCSGSGRASMRYHAVVPCVVELLVVGLPGAGYTATSSPRFMFGCVASSLVNVEVPSLAADEHSRGVSAFVVLAVWLPAMV